jgi:hypothetical protein
VFAHCDFSRGGRRVAAYEQRVRTRTNNEPGISYSIGTGIGTYGGGSLLGNGR